MRFHKFIAGPLMACALTACSSGSGPAALFQRDSAAVQAIKNGSVQGCPASTLGVMADAFFSDPQWLDFTSTSGGSVVELTGTLSYQNMPAQALLQFTVNVATGDFEVAYLELNGAPQNKLVLATLLNKMCAAL